MPVPSPGSGAVAELSAPEVRGRATDQGDCVQSMSSDSQSERGKPFRWESWSRDLPSDWVRWGSSPKCHCSGTRDSAAVSPGMHHLLSNCPRNWVLSQNLTTRRCPPVPPARRVGDGRSCYAPDLIRHPRIGRPSHLDRPTEQLTNLPAAEHPLAERPLGAATPDAPQRGRRAGLTMSGSPFCKRPVVALQQLVGQVQPLEIGKARWRPPPVTRRASFDTMRSVL